MGLRGRASPGGSRNPGPGRVSPECRGEDGPWPSNFWGTCREHWYQPPTAQMGKLRPRRAASPGALGSLSRSRCNRPSPRSTHRPVSGPHAALRRPWASELATKLIGSSWKDQGRRKAAGTKRTVPVSVEARERKQQRGEGRGRRPSSTPDAARRTRRRLCPLSGRSACQSLCTFANHRAPRRLQPTGPRRGQARGRGSGPPTAKVSELTRAVRPRPNPCTPRHTHRASGLLCPAASPRARLQTTFHPLLWPQAPQLQIYYHCFYNIN